MFDNLHDLAVLCVILSPIAIFVGVLIALVEMYDSDPPSQIIKRWVERQAMRGHLDAIWWWV